MQTVVCCTASVVEKRMVSLQVLSEKILNCFG